MSILYHGSHHGQNVQAVTLYKISYLTEIQKKEIWGLNNMRVSIRQELENAIILEFSNLA